MASKTDSTRVMWRVQVRKSRNHAWKNAGLFETRSVAREVAAESRGSTYFDAGLCQNLIYGFGNTRVVRHVRGGGR